MGNISTKCNTKSFLKSKLLTYEEHSKDFTETFQDINFIGMDIIKAVSILKERGYTKYKIWPHKYKYYSKRLNGDVILYTDMLASVITKDPIYM